MVKMKNMVIRVSLSVGNAFVSNNFVYKYISVVYKLTVRHFHYLIKGGVGSRREKITSFLRFFFDTTINVIYL